MSRQLLLSLLLPALAFAQEDAGLPAGWFVSGEASDYHVTMVTPGACGERAAQLVSSEPAPHGPVALMQTFRAEDYRGSRVRLSATLDTRDVAGWAGIFVRVDSASKQTLRFEDMRERPLRHRWPCVDVFVVVDVPSEAEWLSFGVRLEGSGAVELAKPVFERVPQDVALTTGNSGQVGGAWFTSTAVVGNVSPTLRVRLAMHKPGDWRSPRRDGEARVESEHVFVRMLSPDLLDGAFRVSRADNTTLIEGDWGTAARRYPAKISFNDKRVDMSWGILERHLVQAPSANLKPGCRLYVELSSRGAYEDQLELCGAVLSPTPPTVQTVSAFLMAGFRRMATRLEPPPRD